MALRHENICIFIDESGKPEIFSAKGENLVAKGVATKFLILCAVRTKDPLGLQKIVTNFKLELMDDQSLVKIFSPAYSLDNFHAQKDYPEVREKFYGLINKLPVQIDVLVVEKLKCRPQSMQHKPGKLYGFMTGQLLKTISHQSKKTEVIFSRKDSKYKLRSELEEEVERVRLKFLKFNPKLNDHEITLTYQHNPHYTHAGLQVADYVAYAVFKAFEVGDLKYYNLIKGKIGKVTDLCNKKYYLRSNPFQLSS